MNPVQIPSIGRVLHYHETPTSPPLVAILVRVDDFIPVAGAQPEPWTAESAPWATAASIWTVAAWVFPSVGTEQPHLRGGLALAGFDIPEPTTLRWPPRV